jgi:hypothetical protein
MVYSETCFTYGAHTKLSKGEMDCKRLNIDTLTNTFIKHVNIADSRKMSDSLQLCH